MDAKHSLPLSAVLAWKDFGMCVHEAIRFNHFDGRIQLSAGYPPDFASSAYLAEPGWWIATVRASLELSCR